LLGAGGVYGTGLNRKIRAELVSFHAPRSRR